MVVDFQEIKHGPFTIFKVPVQIPNKDKVLNGINDLVKHFRPGIKTRLDLINTMKKGGLPTESFQPGPGIQITLSHSDDEHIVPLQSIFNKRVLEFHNTRFDKKADKSFGYSWVFISDPSNPDTNYHEHGKMSPLEPLIQNTWTWVYYLQVPDNCSGDEGKIFFSHDGNDDNALKLFPEEDFIYIFPGTLLHRPELSPNSTNSRVTLAGNIFLNFPEKVLL